MHRAVAVALAFCLPLPAADLVVEPGNPAAYQTLQAALDAAQPGDRILIAAPLMAGAVVVQKGVTIEPLGGGRQSIAFFGQTGGIHIAALTPGVPFVLRRLDLGLYEMGGPIQGIRTAGTVPGEVHFDEVTVHRAAANQHTIYGGGSLVRLHTTTVWLRQCTLVAHDLMRNNGCIDLDGTQGTDALVVEADTLRLERVALRGSSANHLDYHCCFPNGSSCQGQFAAGGHGGAALRATTRVTLLVDGDLSDGNGGTVGAGPWVVPASGGAAGTSGFGGQTGTLATWATRHEAGLPGHVGNPHGSRGVTTAHGPAAPLSVGGPATPGSTIDVTLATPGLSVLLGGIAWGEQPTVLGTWWVAPLDVLPHPGHGVTQQWALPAVSALRSVPVVLQAVRLFPQVGIDNPSGILIR
jgi:hypothetical protein